LDGVLRTTGLVLIAIGFGWAALRLMLDHPYLVLIVLGLACLVGSLVVTPGGLLRSLPPCVQDFLVRKTPFDLLYDDSRLRNFLRRWGRMQLLAIRGARSESEIGRIVEDLDPAFVDTVLGKTFLQIVPASVRRLLVPATREDADMRVPVFGEKALQEHDRRTAAFAASGAPGSSALSGPCHLRHLDGVGIHGRWTPAEIAQLLRAKDQARGRRITEPEIGIVALRVLALGPMLRSWGNILVRSAQTTVAILAVGWAGCALLLRGGLPQLRGVSVHVPITGESLVAKAACVASALSLLSAGAAVVITAYSQRFASLWESVLSESAAKRVYNGLGSSLGGSDAADCGHTDTEPEHEESPAVDA